MENASDNELSTPIPEDTRASAAEPQEEPNLRLWERLKLFLTIHWRGIVSIAVPIILVPILSFPPEKYQWCAYSLVIMAIFWVTECIPLAVTSFIPVIVFPLTGIMNTATTCKCYVNDTVIMFLASMILAYSVEQSGLHKRLALCAIRAIGYSHYRLLFAISFITMFISMWITNTAATTLMVPICFAVLNVFEEQNLLRIYEKNGDGELVASDMTTCYFCAVTFSATIGGIGTLVGTVTNLVFKGLFMKKYPLAPEYLSFPKFSAFSIPCMLIMELTVYLYMIVVYFGFLRPNSKVAQNAKTPALGIEAAKKAVQEDWLKLGKITFWEIMVIILFSGAMILFFSRSPQIFIGWGDKIADYYELNDYKFIKDSAVAMLVAFLMLLLPSRLDFFKNFTAKSTDDLTKQPVPSILRWTEMNETLPYSYMFLLGGGIALSEASKEEYSNLNGKIGILLRKMNALPNELIILLIILFTVFLTNFASNVAVCNVIVPIVMQLATEIKKNPLWYNIAAGLSSSFAFCLPVGTPGNLIVQSVAKIPTKKMVLAGSGPSILIVLITWISVCFWAPVIWPNLHTHTQ